MKCIKFIITALFVLAAIFSFSQEFPTRGEIYDYEVGDVFHITFYGTTGSGGYGYLKNIEVLDKTYFEDSTIVTYSTYVKLLEDGSDYPEEEYSEYHDTISYTGLSNVMSGDSVIENPDWYNGRKTVFIVNNESMYTTLKYRFAVGCGKVYYEYNSFEPMYEAYAEEQLVYYKKGEEEWGEEQTIVGIEEVKQEDQIIIYPNPASDYIHIVAKENETIQIYNTSGQMILMQQAKFSESQIDVSNLPVGIYYVKIISIDGTVTKSSTKFLKK